MFKSILKILGFAGKKAQASVGKSLDFMDEALEKEYISSSVEKAKSITGDMVEKAGTAYQKGVNTIEALSDSDQIQSIKEKLQQVSEKVEEKTDQLLEKGKQSIEENPKLKSTIDKMSNAGKDALEKVTEAGKDAVQKIEDTAEDISKKVEDTIFGEEE